MLDIILDTLIDSLKMLPFLFVAFLLIELIEHKFSDKTKKVISSSGKFGPLLGGVLGAIPQCGFSVLATNLYITRIVSLGTLIAIYLSTSDEMLPILISHNVAISEIIKIISIKVIIGMIMGFIIDLVYHNNKKSDFHICEESDCDCEESIIKSSIIHTLKTISFIALITFILNAVFNYFNEDVIKNMVSQNKILTPFIASLIGLIPNCGSSVMITELYLNNVITLGSGIAGLLTGSGVALLVLFKSNKNIKENIIILSLIYFIGVISGIIINFII
ncbi:MAG: arsenic efflux protein [Bacilli bacterium]|nr:arsenic efflux protein [Bacilli bacterium]